MVRLRYCERKRVNTWGCGYPCEHLRGRSAAIRDAARRALGDRALSGSTLMQSRGLGVILAIFLTKTTGIAGI